MSISRNFMHIEIGCDPTDINSYPMTFTVFGLGTDDNDEMYLLTDFNYNSLEMPSIDSPRSFHIQKECVDDIINNVHKNRFDLYKYEFKEKKWIWTEERW